MHRNDVSPRAVCASVFLARQAASAVVIDTATVGTDLNRRSNVMLVIGVMLIALFCFVEPTSAVTMDWAFVGNPNNAPDPLSGSLYGSVSYSYSISKYEVTNSQYVEFLNSNDADGGNALGLFNSYMSNATYGGITYNPSGADGSKYGVITGNGNHPVNYVTFFDALRFTNWLNNGQVPGSTESGAYTLLGGTPTPSNSLSISRTPGATVVLPSENEWYKAAYFNPDNDSYFYYPTSSNLSPAATAPTSAPESANYHGYPPQMGPENVTDVGAYSGTTSPYGLFGMGGNVSEWNEALIGAYRGVRGGGFSSLGLFLQSTHRGVGMDPAGEYAFNGFRVATVPEPSSVVICFTLLPFALVALCRRRRKQVA